MARNCSGCGAELFGGQRFCRVCGRPTADLEGHDSPTQVMPPSAVAPEGEYGERARGMTGPAPGVTAPTAARTGPVPQYAPAEYRPSPPAYYQPPPSNGGGRWGWIIAFIAIGLFAGVMFAVLEVSRAARNAGNNFRKNFPPVSDTVRKPGDQDFGQTGAITSLNSTTVTRDFPLNDDATFSLININGDISVETWDQKQAEVTITKSGGSADARDQTKIVFNGDEDALTLKSLRGSSSSVTVKYEVKLPRSLDKLSIQGTNSVIKIANIESNITAQSTNGSIELRNIKGGATVQTVNGSIDAAFDDIDDDDPLKFSTVNGNVKLQIPSDLEATLNAQTNSGTITLDDSFGISVEKKFVGQEAKGNIGDGGKALTVKTTNGSISITK